MKRVVLGGLAVGITLLAASSAWVTNQGLAYYVAVPEEALPTVDVEDEAGAPLASNDVSPRTRKRSERQLIDGIMDRNLFDHTAIGSTQAPIENNPGGEELTDLKLRLLATMVAEPAMYSSALIALDDQGGVSNGYGIGDTVTDGAVVVEIEKKRVVLERNGGREILVFDEKEAPPKRGGTVSKATKTDDESGISEAGDNKFTIPRETLDKYIGDLDAIAKMGRARPHRDENGKTDGFRLSGIRKSSLGSKLGIKTGDVVHSVNGKGLTNAKEAMEAWQTLQNDNSFSFEITRRGKKQTMEYTVR